MLKNQFLIAKNSLLELWKDFTELKHREVKTKREIEELFFEPIIVSTDEMDKFEKKKMKNIRPIKNTWYDRLITYIPEPMRKSVDGFKEKTVIYLKTNTPKQTMYGRGKKLSKPKTQNIRHCFILKKKKRNQRWKSFWKKNTFWKRERKKIKKKIREKKKKLRIY